MNNSAIRFRIEQLNKGGFLATSLDVPSLVAEGRNVTNVTEVVEIIQQSRPTAKKISKAKMLANKFDAIAQAYKLNYRLIFLLIIIILFYGNDGFAQTGELVPEMVNVDEVFSNFMNDWDVPGGSIAIVRNGRLVYARGFGYADRESNELVQPHHLFRIASISKPITSIAIMKLIDQGLINVEAKVFGTDGILNGPGYNTILDSRVEDITVRHLLRHTSGWGFIDGRHDPMFYNQHIARRMREKQPVGPNTIIKFMLTTQTLDSKPGINYFYSNFGFCILGRVIEQVSGKNYENYVKTELLEPLGISEMQLGQNLHENKAPNEVKYYDYSGSSLTNSVYGTDERVPWPYGGFNIGAMDSHGGWIASAIDIVRLLVAVDGFDTKPDIISQSSIQLMVTPSNANSYYGMGWAVTPWGNWWHNGSLPGTSSITVKTSGGLGWAVLFNTRPSNWQDFNLSMDNMVWEAIGGVDNWPTHDLFEQIASVLTPTTLKKISGDDQQGSVGTALAAPFVVSVLDEDGAAIAGVAVTFSVTAGGGTLSAATVTTDANGRARNTLTLGSEPGTNTVSATVARLEPATFTATAIEQIPHSLTKVSGDGQEGLAGIALAAPFVVSVLDEDGLAIAGVVVTFSVTAGEGVLSITTATTDANGQATTTLTLTLSSNTETNTVEATVAGLEPETFTATAVGQAIPDSLVKVSGDGQEGTVGDQLAAPFVVSVLDGDGAAIAGAVVTFSVTAGGGALSDTTATTDANSQAVARLTLGSEPGTNTVAASVEGLESVTFTATGQKDPLASLFDAFLGGGKRVVLPDRTQLLQNAPNPFNSETVLSYFLLEPGSVRLEVFALSGQRVAILYQGLQQAGYHQLHWDSRDSQGRLLASGMYLYRLVTDEGILTRKLTLLR